MHTHTNTHKRVWIPKKTKSSFVCLHSNTSAVGKFPTWTRKKEVEDGSQLVEGLQTAKPLSSGKYCCSSTTSILIKWETKIGKMIKLTCKSFRRKSMPGIFLKTGIAQERLGSFRQSLKWVDEDVAVNAMTWTVSWRNGLAWHVSSRCLVPTSPSASFELRDGCVF